MKEHLVTILRCDDVPEPDRSRHGDCHERLAAHLTKAAEVADLHLKLKVLDVRDSTLPADDDPSALFVTTGSVLEPFADVPWVIKMRAWLPEALQRDVPIYAICFGHQAIAEAMAGTTRRAPQGWEVGCVSVEKRYALPVGGARAGVEPSQLPPPAEKATRVRLFMSHRDEVATLPAGAIPWLVGDNRPHQGFVIPGKAVTVQGHPEYESEQAAAGYRRKRGRLGPDLFEDAMTSLGVADDGVVLSAEVLLYFLGQQEDTPD